MPRSAIFLSPGADLAAAGDLARRADAAGYESVWVTHGVGRDGLQVLSAYAHAAPRVGLGTGVLPIYPRHPVLLAQEALTLQEVSGGRLRLGIGVSHRPVMEGALGLEMGKPLEVAREYVAVLRQALTGRVQHTGPRYQVTWQSGVPRLPAPPPIYLAGLGTAMLELAGEIADGAVLWLCAPAYVREHALPAIRRGRERAGKPLDGFEIVVSVPAAVTTDRAAGRKSSRSSWRATSSCRSTGPCSRRAALRRKWPPGIARAIRHVSRSPSLRSGRRRLRSCRRSSRRLVSPSRRHPAVYPPHGLSRRTALSAHTRGRPGFLTLRATVEVWMPP
jgi:alkanesulfonate monooxygenase SsuD/methylene tetrahydromethanopterin reductase-like flavin-dependent oxidoreductase (luciferase family)